jgi:gluconate:H+ symporter, GntP family
VLHPGLVFGIALVLVAVTMLRWRWPLPLALLAAALLASLLAGFWMPWRHLVEGGFGLLNLVLALFAGAFFGQAMRLSGAADALAARLFALVGERTLPALLVAGALLFVTGMFVGIAGVAVLAVGVFAVPLLRLAGLANRDVAAFVAVLATCGMVAPPVNVPAMMIADGVNMPFLAFERALLLLAVPTALAAVLHFRIRQLHSHAPARGVFGAGAAQGALTVAMLGLLLTLGFWTILRVFPQQVPDPAVPIVLVIGALVALPLLDRERLRGLLDGTFGGTPLVLAAVLVTVGVAVQVMTLTGIRGWVVINTLSFPPPWLYVALAGLPIVGGTLTAMGTANVLGVPFAFAFIHQEMILNVAALSAIAALSEFVPPTAIATALACYVADERRLFPVIRASLLPMAFLVLLAVLLLVFAAPLTPFLA